MKDTKKKQDKECKILLQQNLLPRRTLALMSVSERMIKTKAWKKVSGFNINSQCRLCRKQRETGGFKDFFSKCDQIRRKLRNHQVVIKKSGTGEMF